MRRIGEGPAPAPLPPVKEPLNNTLTFDDLRNQHVNEIIAKRPLPALIEQAMRTVRCDLHLPGLDPAMGPIRSWACAWTRTLQKVGQGLYMTDHIAP